MVIFVSSLQFPDQNGTGQGKKSTVYITGPIESTICAKVQLMVSYAVVYLIDDVTTTTLIALSQDSFSRFLKALFFPHSLVIHFTSAY